MPPVLHPSGCHATTFGPTPVMLPLFDAASPAAQHVCQPAFEPPAWPCCQFFHASDAALKLKAGNYSAWQNDFMSAVLLPRLRCQSLPLLYMAVLCSVECHERAAIAASMEPLMVASLPNHAATSAIRTLCQVLAHEQ